jgi:dipeptidyl aminopeptidase/acylaminoacyl peptidase
MSVRFVIAVALFATALPLSSGTGAQGRRAITLADHSRLVTVADPQRSPEGQWVAYTATTVDAEADKRNTDLWMVRWDGSERVQLTSSPDNESSPRWSPDGKYLAFIASRGTEEEKKKGSQIWLLNRLGGEAIKVTDLKGGVSDIVWSPDSTRIAFVKGDEDPDDAPEQKEGWKRKTAPPIVIDRYAFKRDRVGYLKRVYDHIAVLDVATKNVAVLTSGHADHASPAWSPDGKHIAFRSRRGHPDPDRTANDDLWAVEARGGAEPRRLTTTPEAEAGRPAWSPNGQHIAILVGDIDRYGAYDMNKLAIVPAAGLPEGGRPVLVLPTFDRAVADVHWSADGERLHFLVQDDRAQHAASAPARGAGAPTILTSGRRSVRALNPGKDGHFAVLTTTPTEPAEIYALEDGRLRQLTTHNDQLRGELQLATTEDFASRSADGTEVHGLIVKPAAFKAGQRYPTLLIVHGGPNSQDEHAFSFDRELLAAHGYVVLAMNYRGSAGRGNAYQKAIFGNWGHLEVMDVLGAVDEAVRQGIADPKRLGIAGWSYGGITTNYVIASDQRFRAAVSGAGSSLWFGLYGVDQYVVQYDQELGPPWEQPSLWQKLSYPFFNVQKIKTPTLFLVGEKDFNVPAAGSEQMYQALRSVGVPTELVIYPGQFHSLTTPSYERDRLQRYLDWFNKYLLP